MHSALPPEHVVGKSPKLNLSNFVFPKSVANKYRRTAIQIQVVQYQHAEHYFQKYKYQSLNLLEQLTWFCKICRSSNRLVFSWCYVVLLIWLHCVPVFFSNWILKHIAVSGCMCDCSITHVDSNVGICAPGCIGVRDSVFFCFVFILVWCFRFSFYFSTKQLFI